MSLLVAIHEIERWFSSIQIITSSVTLRLHPEPCVLCSPGPADAWCLTAYTMSCRPESLSPLTFRDRKVNLGIRSGTSSRSKVEDERGASSTRLGRPDQMPPTRVSSASAHVPICIPMNRGAPEMPPRQVGPSSACSQEVTQAIRASRWTGSNEYGMASTRLCY